MKTKGTMLKKCFMLVLVVAMITNMLPINVLFATSYPDTSLELTSATGKPGDEVTVDVKLNNNPGFRGLSFIVEYDKDKLELEKDSDDEYTGLEITAFKKAFLHEFQVLQEGKILGSIMAKGYSSSVLTDEGVIGTLTFKIKDGVNEVGSTPLKVTVNSFFINAEDDTGEKEEVEDYKTVDGAINIDYNAATSVTLNKSELTLDKGQSETLTATIEPSDADDKVITWTSSKSGVASVDSTGKVTALSKGTTVITATAGKKTATCNVTVRQPIEGITLDETSLLLERDDTKQLVATINPSNADGDKTITWDSTEPSVATVSDTGLITAVGKGSTKITAKVAGFTATCDVTVGIGLKSISLNETTLNLNKGDNSTLVVTYNPTDTDVDKSTLAWSSSNTAVATVNNGEVSAVGAGDAVITAKIAGKIATVNVHVEVPLNSISIKSATSIDCGQTETLTVTYDPVDTTVEKNVVWTSDNEKVATVKDGVITTLKPGTANIKATVAGKEATCALTVNPVPLNSISIKEQNITLEKGKTSNLTVTYNPETTTDDKTVTWSSDADDIVSVDNGVITAKKAGEATITAKVGEKTATTKVTVIVPLKSISLKNGTDAVDENNGVTLKRVAGETPVTLTVVYDPDDTTVAKDVEWLSTNTDVVTVKDGVLTPVKKGTAYVIAKVDGKEAKVKVEVKVPLTGIELADKTKIDLIKGQTSNKLVVNYLPDDTSDDKTVTWTSSADSVATVENGVITAKSKGTATITATVGNFTDTVEVEVTEIPLNSISIDKKDFDLGIGRSQKLGVLLNPENTTDDVKVVWSSSDDKIATVDEQGNVKAIAEGTATITATVGNKTASVKVTVNEVLPDSITIKIDNGSVKIGDKLNYRVVVDPEDVTYMEDIIVSSSNNDVLFVNEDGTITVKSYGTAILTAEAKNGVKTQLEVSIVDPNPQEENTTNNNETASNSPKTGDIPVGAISAALLVSLATVIVVIKKRK